MSQFARFVVRPDCQGVLLGFNFGLLKEGVVYEVTEVLGELVLREVGASPLGTPPAEAMPVFGFSNAQTHESLLADQGGRLVMTVDEIKRSRRGA